jgi:hypothetical protein
MKFRKLPSAFAILILLSFSGPAFGKDIQAASCSQSHVQSAINSASSGDRVLVPAGTCTWDSVEIPNGKAITLQGAGPDLTKISGAGYTLLINHIGSGGVRVTGFEFKQTGFTSTDKFNNSFIRVRGQNWRIHGNKFVNGEGPTFMFCIQTRALAGDPNVWPGLIDNNEFVDCHIWLNGNAGGGPANSGASKMWSEPLDLGGPDNVFVEDNHFLYTGTDERNGVQHVDAGYAMRYVLRHNTFLQGITDFHGLNITNTRGGRSWEIYDNTYHSTVARSWLAIRLRGGTGVVFNNTTSGTYGNGIIRMDNSRSHQTQHNPPCDGKSNIDGNIDEYGWPCRDQVGRGQDEFFWTSESGPPPQTSVPAYFWSNTHNGNLISPECRSVSDMIKPGGPCRDIQHNRDFYRQVSSFNGTSGVGVGTLGSRPSSCTAGVGYWATDEEKLYKCTATNTWTLYYQPYIYPHPLRSASAPAPAPPTNLTVVSP